MNCQTEIIDKIEDNSSEIFEPNGLIHDYLIQNYQESIEDKVFDTVFQSLKSKG